MADARLPTGSHAHSGGLEPALRGGLSLAQVPDYIKARLRTTGYVEASAAVLARRAADRDPAGLPAVEEALLARMPSQPQRTASGLLGRGLRRLALRLWPDRVAVHQLSADDMLPTRPIALGVVASSLGMDDAQVARASLYDDAQTIAAAALKLLPVDPVDATGWLVEAASTLEEVVTLAVAATEPSCLPGATAPLIEQQSLEHDRRSRRIFVA